MKKLITLLALIFVTAISYGQTQYYSKATGDLDLVTTWGLATDGTGANPTNFTTASQVFNIRNRATATIGAAWTVSGGTSKIVVGDGVSACNFTIPDGFPVTGSIDVSAGATLTIQDATNPSLGTLNTTSTVDYNGNTSQTIAAATYGNLVLSGDHTGGTITLASGTISLTKGFTVTATNIGGYSVTGNTFSYTTNTAQTVGGITYNNLTLSNGASTKTAGGDITVNGTLTTTSGGTFAMSTFTLSDGGSMTVTNNGTISTASTNNPPYPSGKTWTGTTGTVTFASTTGGQSIPNGTYKNITFSNTSGTNTATSDLSLTGTFTQTGAGTVDMGTFAILSANTFTLANTSILKTQNTSATPIPSGKTIGGTVNYNAATGGQTVVPETSYRNLTLGNTSGTSSPSGDLVVTTLVTTTAGGTFDMGTNAISGAAAYTNGGTIKTQNTSSAPFTTGKTFTGGTVEYNGTGAQTVVAGTYTGTLLVSGDRGTATVTLETGTISVSGTFSLTATNVSYSTTGNTFNYSTAAGGKTIYSAIPYNNLTLGNTSGTNTVDGNLTVNGALVTTTGATATLDLSTFDLGVTPASITNNGTIKTASLTNPALPTGQTWSGTTGAVIFSSTTGGQSIPYGTYKTLTCQNTSGTNTVVGSGTLALSGVLTAMGGASGILDMGTNPMTSSSTITNTGTIKTQNTSSAPLPTGKTWTGTVEYNSAGNQTIMAGTYTNITLSADHGAGTITLESGTISLSGNFSLTATNIAGYTNTGNTVTYTGNTANTVAGISYNNLTLTNAAASTKTAGGDISVNGTLTTTSAGFFDMSTFTLSDGGSMTVTNNGSITTQSTNNPALPTGKTWSGTTGLVTFARTAGGQFIPGGTYKTLTCVNTSNTNTVVGGDLTLSGVLTTSAAGGTLDMGTNALVSSSTITNTGTIKTQNTSSTPLPTGKTWVGTVHYNSAGNQTIMAGTYTNMALAGDHGGTGVITLESGAIGVSGNFNVTATNIASYTTTGNTFTYSGNTANTVGGITYNNLTLSNTSATKTADGNVTVDGALSIASNGILDMSTFTLAGAMTAVTLNGTLTTQSTNNPAIPSGKTWSGTTGLVTFAKTTGGQFIPAGSYKTLTCSNTSGTNTAVGNITMTGVLTTSSAGGTLDMGTNTLASSSTITNTGTILTQNTSSTPLPSGKTWVGTVNYNAATGAQTVMIGTYTTVTLDNTSGIDVAEGAISISAALNVTNSGATFNMSTFALSGTLTTITNNGLITTDNTGATPLTTGKTWGGTGTVRYNVSTGTQTIMAGTYNNLTLNNSSGTNTASGSITVNGTLTTTGNGILDMGAVADQLLGAGMTVSMASGSTIQTSCNVSPAIPTGKTWAGTVKYIRLTGGQFLPAGTFNNLTMGNTSATQTALGTVQVDGAFVTTSGGTLSMGTNQLTGAMTSVTNDGTITTACTANPAMPTGKTWSGTTGLVTFTSASGGQFIPGGTYKTLTCSNTSGTNTVVGGDITMSGVLTTSSAGGTLDMGTNALVSSSTITNTGTIQTQNTSSTPLPTGKTWVGTVQYNGSANQTMVAGTFTNLALSGDHTGGTITLESGTISLSGNFNYTATNVGAFSVTGNTVTYTGNTANTVAGITYNNLTLTNASNTKTAGGDVTVNTALTTTAGGSFDMSTNQLSGAFTPTNAGTLLTGNTSSNPIPSGLTWAGTVNYNGTGAQTIVTGTYATLTLSGARTGSPTITLENGNINLSGSFNVTATGVGSYSPGTNTFTYTGNTNNTVGGITYNNLACTNTTMTKTAGGDITVNGTLSTASGGTLAMSTFTLSGITTVTNNGAITTSSTNNPAIPASKDWSGTTGSVTFGAATGGQFIPLGNYKTLACSNTSNTNTVVGSAGILTVTGTFTTNGGASGSLDMGTNAFTATTITNTGTIFTQCLSSTPIPTGKTIAGTVNYNAATGGQTVVTETSYAKLSVTNSSGTSTANGNMVVNGTMTTGSGTGVFDLSTFTITGNASFAPAGGGTIKTQNSSAAPIKTGMTWTQTVEYNRAAGGQTIMNGTYAGLTNSNTSGTNTVAAAAAITVNGTLTLTAGSVLADNNLTITVNGNIAGTGTHNTTATGKISMTGSGGTISGATLGNLTLNNAGGFSLTGSPTVNGTLTLTAGLLTIGSNNLILGTAAPAVAGTPSSSNMIVATSTGQVRKLYTSTGSYIFPVGDVTPNYSPITINVTSGTAGGGAYVGTNVSNTKEPHNANTTNYLNRYWGVSVSGFTSPVYSLTASYVAPTDVVGTETSIAAGQYTGSLPWVKFGVVNDVAHTFSATALSSTQSNFTGISNSNPLVSVLPTTATICSGNSQSLDASGSGDPTLTYTWAPSTGLSATTGASVVAAPTTTVTTTIVYTVTITDGNGQTATATSALTVNPAVAAITGTTTVCETFTTALNDATGGGTWSTSNASVATVGSGTGIVSGVSAGVATISYVVGPGCYSTTVVTVNDQPGTITGTPSVCIGFTTALGNPDVGGTWTSSTPANATIGSSSGVVTGVAAGVSQITYTLPAGCYSTVEATVNANPSAITGTASVCETFTTTLNNADAGGTWSSSNISIATVGSDDGVVTGVAQGNATISYIFTGTGCYATKPVTVNTQPGSITGTLAVCVGASSTLGNSVNGGTWSSSNTSKATIGSASGSLTGVASGLSNITYALSNGCYSTAQATVNANPSAITGTASACETFTSTLNDADAGGTWSSSNASIATVGSATGIVTGVLEGNATISYIFTGTGCYATKTFTVNNQPGAITGSMAVCVGSTSDIDNAETGGTWVSSSLSNVTVDYINGILTGVAAGNANITYTLSNGCYATAQATANANPSAITGTAAVCEGFTTTLNDADAGGTWSSANNSTATVGSATGVVTGVASGIVNISYTFTGTGCYATRAVTVITSPSAITGTATVCVAANTTLGNSQPGGTWSSSAPSIATVGSSSGVVTGVAAGNATITYTISAGCYATKDVTVNPLPNAGTITGTANLNAGASFAFSSDGDAGGTWSASNAHATVSPVGLVTGVTLGSTTISYAVTNSCGTATATYVVNTNTMALPITGAPQTCVGYTTQLAHAYTGGTWSSSNTSTATVGSTTGIVTGVAFGNVTITYHANSTFVTINVLVNSFPPPISGSNSVCVGFTSLLTHATAGGTWESSNVSAATIGTSGLVTGVAAGVTVVTYTINSTCHITKSISVYDNPVAISGASSVCQGSTITLSDATPTGLSWSSSNMAVGTIASSGVFRGLSGGSTTITYTTTVGCYATKDVTVNAIPTISGTATVCATFTTTLNPTIGGGTWASSSTAVATVGSSTGIVTGVAAGTARMTYTPASGCIATQVVTVSSTPAAITGTTLVCVGNTVTLGSATPSCTWSSSTPAVATIGTNGVVTGVGAGTTQISYTNAVGCRRTTFVTVNSAVASITGTPSSCVAATSTLSDATPSGVWSGSNPTIATINSSGVVTGVSAGTINVSYTLSAGCKQGVVFTVNALPAAITGTANACIGFTSTLNDATAGGTWSSSNASIASVGSATGVVTAVAAGNATITYTGSNTCRKTVTFTSKSNPSSITGVNYTCIGAFCTLFCPSGSGLAWSSSTPAVGTVNSISGDVTGISAGTTTITFTNTSNCYTTRVVSVSATPDGGIVTGPGSVTTGNTISFSAQYSYGSWTTSDAGVATVSQTSISTADVTGVSIGAATISYTADNGCGPATTTVNVNVPSRPGIHSNNGGGSATTSDGKEISFYPNPTTGSLTLVAPEAGKFYIFTVDGKQVADFDAVEGKTKIEMPKKLASGTYMCRYESKSGASVIIRIVYEP